MLRRIKVPTAFSPLSHPVYRALWIASLVSNIGTWTQEVGQAWLMTSLTDSAFMIALIQTAESLPLFLFSLPAGAVADIMDRKRMLILTQLWMLLGAAALTWFTVKGIVTPWILLSCAFAIFAGAAVNGPAWQATMPRLVPDEELRQAVTLNGIGYNLARVAGPALGGVVVSAAGPAATFFLNALSFVGVIVVLHRWKPTASQNRGGPAENVLGAMITGLRYTRHSKALKTVLLRTVSFIFFGSAVWGLLPVLARQELNTGSFGYGLLLGALGGGAVTAALLLPKLRARFSLDQLLLRAKLTFATMLLGVAYFRNMAVLLALIYSGGFCWMIMMSSFNVATQTAVPAWVRARALSIYLLTSQGGMAFGAALWGFIASRQSLSAAFFCSGGGLVLSAIFTSRLRLNTYESVDLSPSQHWPDPTTSMAISPEDGPVMVTVEYEIDPADAEAFKLAMEDLEDVRRRDGAFQWGLFVDSSNNRIYVETFFVESWAEHLRQHRRVTVADRKIEGRVYRFHRGKERPRVAHLVSATERGFRFPPEWRLFHRDREPTISS